MRWIAIALGVCVPAVGVAAWAGQDPDLEVRRIRPDVAVVCGAGANVVVLDRAEGLVVVDSKLDVPTLRSGLAAVRDAAIAYLIDTHHHVENSGGNAAVAGAGARVVAHDAADRRIRAAGGRGADLRFHTRLTIEHFGETVTCHHKGPGHTDGDTIVHFANANVLAVGGLVADGLHPALIREDGADLRGWIRVLVELERDFRGSDIVVVPGDGEPGGLELVTRQLDYLRSVLDLMEDAQRHGLSREEALREAEVLREKYAHYAGEHFERLLEQAYEVAGR